MLFDRIDIRRLRRDVASASAQCLALKQALRCRWTRPMADEQRALARLSWRVTELCILVACTRGRWHVTVPPRAVRQAGAEWDRAAYGTRIAERVALDYAAPPGDDPPVASTGASAS